jgi:prevent-host-death family protein
MFTGTKIVPVSDLRRKTRGMIAAAREGEDAVYATQHGRPVVVIVSYEQYERLMARLEACAERAAFRGTVAEPSRPYPTQRYPTVAAPASSLNAWMDLIPDGCGGDALADTEALYDEV